MIIMYKTMINSYFRKQKRVSEKTSEFSQLAVSGESGK